MNLSVIDSITKNFAKSLDDMCNSLSASFKICNEKLESDSSLLAGTIGSKVNVIEVELSSLKNAVHKLNSEFDEVKPSVNKMKRKLVSVESSPAPEVADISIEAATRCLKEIAERPSKRRNLIIFGIPECEKHLDLEKDATDKAAV